MKEGEFAIYLGKEYTAGKNKEGKIILRSTDANDVKNGFELCEPFKLKRCKDEIVCLKFVQRSEVEDFFRIKTWAIYKGYKFEIMAEKDNRILIVALNGDYRDWLALGMKCVDPYMYEKWIDKSEAEIEITKEQL